MDYEIIIRPEARVDLLDAFNWYQEQRPGLGFDFKLCQALYSMVEGATQDAKAERAMVYSRLEIIVSNLKYASAWLALARR